MGTKITSKLVAAIDQAIKDNKLHEPFRAACLRKAFGGFADNTYSNFLPKHRRGNPGDCKEYFERTDSGLYKRLPDC